MATKTDLALPAYNSLNWDTPLNSNFTILNKALGSVLAVSISSSDVTLTGSQAENMAIVLSGVLTGDQTLYFPNGTSGSWLIVNSTTGSHSITVSNVSGSATVNVSQGVSAQVLSDGTNFYLVNDGANPPGSFINYAGSSAPSGYLLCDGSAVSRSAYARLFAVIGTTWGSGDGSSTFNVPDFRGAFLRGAGAGLNPSTRAVGSYEADNNKAHTHTATDSGHDHALPTSGGSGYTASLFNGSSSLGSPRTGTGTANITIASSGGTEAVPKNYAVLWCIKY